LIYDIRDDERDQANRTLKKLDDNRPENSKIIELVFACWSIFQIKSSLFQHKSAGGSSARPIGHL